ncbi:MAG TPA: lysylphosphatidylglycerol synthase domain-containing protein [Solirubrobacteraceae bacterium]|jgi:uncharacterized membrane protein YbhN (UPF0104 family)
MAAVKLIRFKVPCAVRRGLSVAVAVALLGGLLASVHEHRGSVAAAVGNVSWTSLLVAALLHLVTIVARSEAWAVSVDAAGARLGRRSIYQVASLGFAANALAPSLGTALRIWALRIKVRGEAIPVSTLVATEVPVLAMQGLVTASMSISLLAPLSAPWWIAPCLLAAVGVAVAALARIARRSGGPFRGLAALRTGRTRRRILAMVICVAACETARNLVLLRAVGLHAGPFDAMALLVGAGVIGVLPLGPGSSAGAAMLIFGAAGVGPAAAAGLLLTATGFAADLAYAAWGAGDMLWRSCPVRARRLPRLVDLGAAVCLAGFTAVLLG